MDRGQERAMVLDAYRWTRLPGSNIEIRALIDPPLALRYRHKDKDLVVK
jgi:hypothetical protein